MKAVVIYFENPEATQKNTLQGEKEENLNCKIK